MKIRKTTLITLCFVLAVAACFAVTTLALRQVYSEETQPHTQEVISVDTYTETMTETFEQ